MMITLLLNNKMTDSIILLFNRWVFAPRHKSLFMDIFGFQCDKEVCKLRMCNEGKRRVARQIEYDNFEAAICIGYWMNSCRLFDDSAKQGVATYTRAAGGECEG